jgi:hypothetical protein
VCHGIEWPPAPSQWFNPLQQWIGQQQAMVGNVQHNLKVVNDTLLLSKLPEVKPEQLQERLKQLDAVLLRIDNLLKMTPSDATMKRVITQLTEAQTTAALTVGLLLGWLGTLTWVKRKPKTVVMLPASKQPDPQKT